MSGSRSVRNHSHYGIIGSIPELSDQHHYPRRCSGNPKDVRVEEQQELGQGRVVETGRRVPQSIGDLFRDWQFTFRIIFGGRVLR